ncbi:MAG TPA: collagen-like protein, partial [Gammaproteobacteria bacterium]
VAPLRNVVGYLFGLPVLEYAMFALTLPHLAFVVVKGNIPLTTVFSVYLVFFVCAIFYHMTAIAVGMVMKRWIWGYLLSIFSVAFLNLILPALASQFGLKFLQYLSVFPVIGQKVVPLVEGPAGFGPPGQPGEFGPPGDDAPFFSFADPVPFFDWMLSPFWFTLLLQSGLIVTFASMSVRRWQKENKHSLSKPYALGVLAVFIVLVTGNLWPAITGQYLPFAIFGINNLNALVEVIAIGLPLVYVIAIWFLCNFLFANVVPTHHDYVRGVRRAAKRNRKAALPWEDDSANIPFMSLFIVVALLGYWVVYSRMMAAGFMDFLDGTGFAHWRLPLGLGLVLCYSLLLFQVLQYRGVLLTALLLWLLPILVAIVSAAAIDDLTRFQTVVASLSPLATIIMTGMLPSGWVPAFDAQSEMAIMLTGVNTGFVLLTAQVVFLGFRWRQLRQTLN